MANLKLKKLILEVVDNQLRDNDPPQTKEAYERLREAGYSSKEAKEKIGAVVLTEIYDVLKENQPYDKERYTSALDEMVQQCIDFEDDYEISTEWDEWDELVEKGYEAGLVQNTDEMLSYWWQAWEIFQEALAALEDKISLTGLMESQDYVYPFDAWLQDMEMELGNAGEHEKRMGFCKEVLELLDWSMDDSSNFKAAIGEELYAAGETEAGKEWFEASLLKEPGNQNLILSYSWCILENEGMEKAYRLLRRYVINSACTLDNDMLFEVAKNHAEKLDLKEDLKWISAQLEAFEASIEKAEVYNDMYDTFSLPVQQPIVKAAKIYPNDPCPCGSGKKYKKCCGKNK